MPGRIMVTSSSDVPMKGLVPAPRGGRQAAHRARRRADRDRAPERGRPGRQGHHPPRAVRRRALRQRHQRRRAGPPLRRGRGGGRARRSTRASRCRPSRPCPAVWPWWRRPVARCPRSWGPTGRPGCWSRPTTPVRWRARSPACSTTPRCGPGSGAAGRERVVSRFTWQVTAAGTAACYQALLEGQPLPGAPPAAR